MIREIPWEMAVMSAAMPTPPRPTIMMLSCGRGRAALSTAPPPVSTAQPRTAAMSAGMSSSTGTAEARSTTAWVAKPETPRWWWTGSPSRLRCLDPCSRVPSLLLCEPAVQGSRPSSAQFAQLSHRGRKDMTTRWPGCRSVTPEPTVTMRPAASWPSSMGTGRTRLPSTTLRSEWQIPAASIRTRISVGPGAASSSSEMLMGLDSAKGRGRPISSSTAPVIFIDPLSRPGRV